ncbi:branched-chain amino acid ABC transporter substrate-binding protein [Paenibacillus sp. FJAT-26967]|uniref:branched-chain amino acid ABC transporter substrate-binding protein n=1 Tax=Paenibacillus sp. FJAT-26967 TaxID=1729690 RepID=UPI000837D804|nr:branched-chain amino acid ABC transporter substrate-binding protein [Paenibacillus sp. FJAT-26967]
MNSLATIAGSTSFNPGELLRLPRTNNRRPKVRLGISSNLTSAHARELCFGCLAGAQEWLQSDPPYELELLWEEDTLDENDDSTAPRRLVRSGADIVIGHCSSTEALRAAQVYEQAGIPFLAPGTSNPLLTAMGLRNVVRYYGRDDDMAEAMTDVVVRGGAGKVALVWQDILYGRTLAGLLRGTLVRSGIEVATESDGKGHALTATNLAGLDTVVFAGTYLAGAELLEQLKEAGYRGSVVLGDDAYLEEFLAAAQGLQGEVYVVSTGVNTDHSDYEAFRQRYVDLSGLEPGAYSVTSYLAARQGLESIHILAQRGLHAFIDKIRMESFTKDSLVGKLHVNYKGEPMNFAWNTHQVKDGRFVKWPSRA